MRKIIYTRPDGGVSIVCPVINTHPQPEDITEAEERAWDRLPANAINPRWIDATEILADRYFRDAWEDNGDIKVNMPKARELHKERLRALRAPKLTALDVEYQKADERGDSVAKAAIAAQKQVLRDVTADPRIGAAMTPEELKAVMPDILF